MSGIFPALGQLASHLLQRIIPFPDPGPYFRPVTAFYETAVEQLADLPGQHPVIRYILGPSECRILLQDIGDAGPDIFIRQRHMHRPGSRAGSFAGTAEGMASHQQLKQIDAQRKQIRFLCIDRQRQICDCIGSGKSPQDFRSCIAGSTFLTGIDPAAGRIPELEKVRAGQHDHPCPRIHHNICRRQAACQMSCPMKTVQSSAKILAHQDPAVQRINMLPVRQNTFGAQVPLQIARNIADRPPVLIKDRFRPGGLGGQICFPGIFHHDADPVQTFLCPAFRRQDPGRQKAVFRNDIQSLSRVFHRYFSAGCIFFSITSCIYDSSHNILSKVFTAARP